VGVKIRYFRENRVTLAMILNRNLFTKEKCGASVVRKSSRPCYCVNNVNNSSVVRIFSPVHFLGACGIS